jgi:hypothetical protein
MSIATGEAQVTRYTSCACPRSPKTKSGVFNTPFFNKQASAWIISQTTKKYINHRKGTPMYIVSPTVFLLQLHYRIVWFVVLDLVVSRFRLWCIVALAPALFRWPWYLFHPIHLLLVT